VIRYLQEEQKERWEELRRLEEKQKKGLDELKRWYILIKRIEVLLMIHKTNYLLTEWV
jgi:hypothetical protein